MKLVANVAVISAVLLLPLAAYAQSSAPLTRAEVRQQVIELENAGYNPSTSDSTAYPENIQAAQNRLNAAKAGGGYGGVADSSVSSGAGRRFYQGDDSQ
ncbi:MULTISPECIES: DUF4148 domain-containing protein [Paraburkholderia]|jgi:hypothetical protein|uniref:DUF4148 domain-containing protein n=1 Tax=Paraburkholderia hospita TaxID=169430 RepID=A0AAJ4X719_9BURK|nr:DUF4148 domain-containing protein [Paraburkholderia hospita]EUC11784.1 Protein of unknown function DUF4148 [Burkholderia sp. BT03]AUT74782.1 DUF4148 domain-containing protein [Paraburkholderia hospita]EIM97738.1 hypothetical protein WQE_27765 [Paraburkholderia hospita]OUL69175.1 hypothetical protein CA602_50010 [Paraburkholderia hospita]OUL80102.1 hypothetical protein CA601_32990 [Paraburkholderia hospita]